MPLGTGRLETRGRRGSESLVGGSLVLLGHFPSVDTVPLDVLSQQFRLLMASTSACYKLFREKQREGHGEAIMFKGEYPRALGREWGAEPPRETPRRRGQSTLPLSIRLQFLGVRTALGCEVTMVGSSPGLL